MAINVSTVGLYENDLKVTDPFRCCFSLCGSVRSSLSPVLTLFSWLNLPVQTWASLGVSPKFIRISHLPEHPGSSLPVQSLPFRLFTVQGDSSLNGGEGGLTMALQSATIHQYDWLVKASSHQTCLQHTVSSSSVSGVL